MDRLSGRRRRRVALGSLSAASSSGAHIGGSIIDAPKPTCGGGRAGGPIELGLESEFEFASPNPDAMGRDGTEHTRTESNRRRRRREPQQTK